MKKHHINGDIDKRTWMFKEFIKGYDYLPDKNMENFLNGIKNSTGTKNFLEESNQHCKNMVIDFKFQGNFYSFRDFWNNGTHYHGPWSYGTDYGLCCLIMPHFLSLEIDWSNFGAKKSAAKNGKLNGFDILLDAEQFNYGFRKEELGVGFKLALHHHGDKPMFQLSSELINVGTNTQIQLKPWITFTTKDTIDKLTPDQRQCYADGEKNLTYLDLKHGYRYEMNNCLIDQAIYEIIWNCRCYPQFGSQVFFCNHYISSIHFILYW